MMSDIMLGCWKHGGRVWPAGPCRAGGHICTASAIMPRLLNYGTGSWLVGVDVDVHRIIKTYTTQLGLPCMFTVVLKPRRGGMADPGLGQQREDMVRMLAELVATQREQAAVAPGVLRSLSNQRRTWQRRGSVCVLWMCWNHSESLIK